MRERILAFLKAENKTSAQFAEEIGVQPSGVSHILSGRNNPSLDFVIKMLGRYKYLSSDWLLFGKGSMLNEKAMPTLFDNVDFGEDNQSEKKEDEIRNEIHDDSSLDTNLQLSTSENYEKIDEKNASEKSIEKIVWFYTDKTCRVFSIE